MKYSTKPVEEAGLELGFERQDIRDRFVGLQVTGNSAKFFLLCNKKFYSDQMLELVQSVSQGCQG